MACAGLCFDARSVGYSLRRGYLVSLVSLVSLVVQNMSASGRLAVSRMPQVVLAAAALMLMLRTERFFTPATLTSILTQSSIVGVLALGQAFVLVGGGFDLSQG